MTASCVSQSRAATFGHHLQDWLDVGRRAADDPEDVACRRLLLQRLRDFAVARLHLLEKPHILDGDHRLIGKGLDQSIWRALKGPVTLRMRMIVPTTLASLEQRNTQRRPDV